MISKLQYITQDLPDRSHAQLAEEACAAGATWIQLRVKNKSQAEWKEIALETQQVCKKYGAKLVVNDNVALARDIKADGVHLGLSDMSTVTARQELDSGFIIGGTANRFEDIVQHAKAKVDYVGVGPYRFTSTKEKLSPILGLDGYKRIIQQCQAAGINVPVIAIGGIGEKDVPALLDAGVYGVAVSSVITKAHDKKSLLKRFHELLRCEVNIKQSGS